MATKAKLVLIVEDEKPLSHALELKLQHEGMTVVVADNGESALKLVKEQQILH
jgi:DNA-binding response OmpR family regulator